jgi:hypothetical protein
MSEFQLGANEAMDDGFIPPVPRHIADEYIDGEPVLSPLCMFQY